VRRFPIKAILTSLIFLTVAVLIGLFLNSFYYSSVIQKANELYSNGLMLKNLSYRVGRDEYRYREYGDKETIYSDIFRKNMLILSEGVNRWESGFKNLNIYDGIAERFQALHKSLKQYEKEFEQLVERKEYIGNLKSGLIAKIENEKLHFLKKNSELKDISFEKEFLKLTIEELNFRLYKQTKYKNNFDKLLEELFNKIKNRQDIEVNKRDALLQILLNYKSFFSEFYDTSSFLGLFNQADGIVGDMRRELYSIQQKLDILIKRAKKHKNIVTRKLERDAIVINILLSVFLASILIIFLKKIEHSINELEHSVSNLKLSSKNLRQRIDLSKVKGFRKIAEDINHMIDNMESYIKNEKKKVLNNSSLLNTIGELSIKLKDESQLINELSDEGDKKSREVKDEIEKIGKIITQENHLFKLVKDSFEYFDELLIVTKDKLEESSTITLNFSNSFVVISNSINNEMVEIISDMFEIVDELETLSIAAAIEASKAGELGEEFSKIADNIKEVKVKVDNGINRIKSEREVSGNLILNISKDILNSLNTISSARANVMKLDEEESNLNQQMSELFMTIATINSRSQEANKIIVELVELLAQLSPLTFEHIKSSLNIVNEIMTLSDQNSKELAEIEKFTIKES